MQEIGNCHLQPFVKPQKGVPVRTRVKKQLPNITNINDPFIFYDRKKNLKTYYMTGCGCDGCIEWLEMRYETADVLIIPPKKSYEFKFPEKGNSVDYSTIIT